MDAETIIFGLLFIGALIGLNSLATGPSIFICKKCEATLDYDAPQCVQCWLEEHKT